MIDPLRLDRNQLDHYIESLYIKLAADVQQMNRYIPHNGLKGAENEKALAAVLREFLPIKFGVEANVIVIDRLGRESKEIDIVIYDATQPKFFRTFFPIEHVYAVIEVKTSLTSQEAENALGKFQRLNEMEYRPELTYYWIARSKRENILPQQPPTPYLFAFESKTSSFETFEGWLPWDFFNWHRFAPNFDIEEEPIRILRAVSLDQGIIAMESSNGHVTRWLARAAGQSHDSYGYKKTTLQGNQIDIDPAKALFLFLWRLYADLEFHQLHPGFDIRSYLSPVLGSVEDGNR